MRNPTAWLSKKKVSKQGFLPAFARKRKRAFFSLTSLGSKTWPSGPWLTFFLLSTCKLTVKCAQGKPERRSKRRACVFKKVGDEGRRGNFVKRSGNANLSVEKSGRDRSDALKRR